jgi:hypothetical protein
MDLIIIILILLFVFGAWRRPWGSSWSYGPRAANILWVVVVILVILILWEHLGGLHLTR